jgi:hypothetical protein
MRATYLVHFVITNHPHNTGRRVQIVFPHYVATEQDSGRQSRSGCDDEEKTTARN